MLPRHADPAPGSASSLRSANQQRVLDVLRGGATGEPVPRRARSRKAELARATGLAPATVSSIVRELTASRLVEADPGSGRRGSSVRLARDAGLVGGVDFGHSHVAVAIGDLTGRLLAEERCDVEAGHHHTEALRMAASMLDAMSPRHGTVRVIGLGLPAPVVNNVIRSSAIFPGWEGVDARIAAEKQFGAPVHVENDANLGALAEHRQGVGRGHDSSVFVKISSGVGAGIIIDNELFHGAGGHRRRDRAPDPGRSGPAVPVRQPRVPGGLHLHGQHLAMMAGQAPGGSTSTGSSRRPGAGTSRPSAPSRTPAAARLGPGQHREPAQPILRGGGGRHGRRRGAAAGAGADRPRRHALDSVAYTPVLAGQLGERASLVGAVLLAAERTELVVGQD